jgi:hypothetical protein
MMKSTRARVVAVLVLVASACWMDGPSAGQSLGEVARREAERRKVVKGQATVFTNESLRTSSGEAPAPAPAPPAAAPADKPAPQAPAAEPAPDPKQQPEYWRKRIGDARAQHARNTVLMEALQSRINALWADFTARDDPAQRAVIASDRQRALAELERMTKERADLDKEIENIQEEARRANIPPGWLR